MLNKSQTQTVGTNSTAYQAEGDITVNGLTYTEVRQLVLDLFKVNFLQLKGEAIQVAQERAEKITEAFLIKLQAENPAAFEQAKTPDFQDALFTIQKEYAKAGDEELGQLLVNLLVNRTKQKERSIQQIVLYESLKVVTKLTHEQLAVLAVVLILKYTVFNGIINHKIFSNHLKKCVYPFVNSITKNHVTFEHLEFASCGSLSVSHFPLPQLLLNSFRGLFTRGFDKEKIKELKISIGCEPKIFVTCLNDPTKLQIVGVKSKILEKMLETVPNSDREKILTLSKYAQMNDAEIIAKVTEYSPFMCIVFDVWQNSPMKHLNLTTVGKAIAHANIEKVAGKFSDLSVWIS